MHQQAILVTGNANLDGAGTPVNIHDIEKHYTTTATANAGITYKCADPKCGVPVIAVITKLTKAKRKSSPSSYFRAKKSKPHVKGCTRESSPSVMTTPLQGSPVNLASPNRTNTPAVWIDPVNHPGGMGGSGGSGGATGTPSSGTHGKRGTSGSGTSQGRSQMVESFAKKWLVMNAQTQRASSLIAPWNPQGTYYSAFHAFAYHRTSDVSTVGQKIYVGILKQVLKTTSGYIVSLSEVNSGGEALEVFIPSSVLLLGTPGASLNSKIGWLVSATKTTQLFVLGTFARLNSKTLSLSVAHPHYIYIP